MSDIPLILFAKVPKAGKVKTRLTPQLSFEQAKKVAEILLIKTLQLATKYWSGKVILAVWPNDQDEFIQKLQSQFMIELMVQVEGDLGQKMQTAMQSVGYPCAVLGCDVPHLPELQLIKAHDNLLSGKDVIGPTNDGGYYLLGLQESTPSLFIKQDWGNDSVLQQSYVIAKQRQIDFSILSAISDIDTYEDLKMASQTISQLRKFIIS